MSALGLLRRLGADRRGSIAVEFGLLGPLMFGLLLGVLQMGLGMHGYNALRGISSDTARFAVVQYQTSNEVTNAQIQEQARLIATTPPYGLSAADVQVSIVDAANQRVDGARELTMTVSYQVPSLLAFLDIESFQVSFSRPIFLLDD